MEKCLLCEEPAIISISGNRPYCARHYVQEESPECLDAYLASAPDNDDPVVLEIRKQRPELYEKRKEELED